MKKLTAFLAALLITACIGLGLFFLGMNALFNPNGVTVASAAGSASSQATVQQLEARIAEYQQREQQYQAELAQAQEQLQEASATLQQYQQLLLELQERGRIIIGRNGQIFIPDR